MIIATGRVRMFDIGCIANQGRFVLRRFTGQEAVKVFKAVTSGPVIKRTFGSDLLLRRVVPLAERRRRLTIVSQDFSDRGRFLGNHSGVTIKRNGSFSNRARTDSRVVASRQQAGARGRTNRRRVKRVVA